MDTSIVTALIYAGPATLAGAAAWYQARGANRAVNQSKGPKLKDQVTMIRATVDRIEEEQSIMKARLTRHLAAHQEDADRGVLLAYRDSRRKEEPND